MRGTPSDSTHHQLQSRLRSAVRGLTLTPNETRRETVAQRRRRRGLQAQDGHIQFVEHNGLIALREAGAATLDSRLGRRARRSRESFGGTVIDEVPFQRLARSQVKSALDALDKRMTGRFGFFKLQPDTRRNKAAKMAKEELLEVSKTGTILLIVHGTFSNGENLVAEMNATKPGRQFLGRALKSYDEVIAFNHRTLAVSPLLNARELRRMFQGSNAEVHVICHSRGGLVTRCWLESMDLGPMTKRRVIFVGSPLAGTSLAAAPNLRATLNMAASIGNALTTVTAAVPFLAFATGLFQIFSSVTRLLGKTPLVDVAIGLVPGLDAMSRVGNNRLIESFQRGIEDPDHRYFAVQANFETDDPQWRFWKYFRNVKARVANLAADSIFDGPNDLVVDTVSMASMADTVRLPHDRVLDFGTSSVVHHTNYFRQPELYAFMSDKLG